MRYLLLIATLTMLPACAARQTVVDAETEAAITAQLIAMSHEQAKAWCENDLDGFMIGFADSEDLRFATPSGIRMGYDTIRAGYAKSIEKSDLRFTDLDVTVLSPDSALLFGRFHNDGMDGSYGTGLFTLLMRKIDGRWKAVHDHSSDLPDDYDEQLKQKQQ